MATTSQSAETAGAQPAKTWFGHPTQLRDLFGIELWERFGFYGMKAILVLYLTQHFLFEDKQAYGIFGAFAALVYLTPFIGGLIADKYLGFRNAVKFGAVLMAAGYLGLAFSGGPKPQQFLEYQGQRYSIEASEVDGQRVQKVIVGEQRFQLGAGEGGGLALKGSDGSTLPAELAKDSYSLPVERNQLFLYLTYLSLSLVIVGTGFFKPNISTMVGDLYTPEDKRRDAGFTLFYMGINVGAFLGQLILPIVRRDVGFNVAFLLAGIGMVISLIWAISRDKTLKGYGEPPNPAALDAPAFGGMSLRMVIMVLSFVALVPFWLLLQQVEVARVVLYAASAIGFIGVIIYSAVKFEAAARDKMIVAVVLTMFSVVFWSLFEQAGTSLTLYAERNTDRHIFGWEMPGDQVQFFNALFIVLLAPVFSMLWTWMGKRDIEPSTPVKFALGLLQVGLAFLILVYGSQFADNKALVPLVWIALAYLLQTTGELCLSPVGLSMITRLSVPSLVGLMMGLWFLSSSLAQAVASVIATFTATETVGGQVLDPFASLAAYVSVFKTIGILGIVIGIVVLAISPLLKKAMHGVR
jgi:proton-dependent oligopeptide transporter, POT family